MRSEIWNVVKWQGFSFEIPEKCNISGGHWVSTNDTYLKQERHHNLQGLEVPRDGEDQR